MSEFEHIGKPVLRVIEKAVPGSADIIKGPWKEQETLTEFVVGNPLFIILRTLKYVANTKGQCEANELLEKVNSSWKFNQLP